MKEFSILLSKSSNDILEIQDEMLILQLASFVKDSNYLQFIKQTNGGYYYESSLHIYGLLPEANNVFFINKILKDKCSFWQPSYFSFAQDIFGNQFVFSNGLILMLNQETGEEEQISSSFLEWIMVIVTDPAFYTGNVFANLLSNKKETRLCPKIPFVLGGGYEESNLYSAEFPKYIEFYSEIERQIRNIPDGKAFVFSIEG